jgi:hypothetical protein
LAFIASSDIPGEADAVLDFAFVALGFDFADARFVSAGVVATGSPRMPS